VCEILVHAIVIVSSDTRNDEACEDIGQVSYTHFVASRTLLYHFEPFVIVSYNHKVLHREVITPTGRSSTRDSKTRMPNVMNVPISPCTNVVKSTVTTIELSPIRGKEIH
jgi:hypothetical protein